MTIERAPAVRRHLAPPRVALLSLYLLVALVQLLQAPGRTTFDTKLDLLVDPGHFLSQSLSLWTPQVGMGELQNQAYGYLFPLGPAFWLGHALAVPAWVTERLWSGLLMIVAMEGARRLALAWGGLGWGSALLAGAAYGTAPRFLATVGTLTGEVLPTAVLPWVVLPLVLSRRGRLGPYAGAVLSGAAVLFMGGQNAAEVAATLPLPFVVLAHAVLRGELPRRTVVGWLAAVVAGCAWWLGPLVLLGRYSPPFLDFIESAANTTSVLSWINSVRGADHWVSFVTAGGRPWWPAGFALATTQWLVVLTAVVAALSLAGLTGRDIPDRVCLTLPVALGLVCLVAAHGGWSGGLFASQLRSLLDGPLAPLRNVHKVDPLVRLPLALGLGYLARDAHRALAARLRSLEVWADRRQGVMADRLPAAWGLATGVAAWVVGCCVTGLLVAAAQPAFAGELRQTPGWTSIPSPWVRAAQAIDELPVQSRVLVLPGSGFGLQVWGDTIDEPLQALTTGRWASRGQAPLTPGGTVRLLDSVESLISTGHGSRALAPLLARSGFTHVLLRTDLDPLASDAPAPSQVAAAFQSSPGLRLVKTFGVPYGATLPLQLWRVEVPGPADRRVTVVPDSDAKVVQGGPEAIVSLLKDHHLLRPWQPVLLAGQNAADAGPVGVLTDTLQRREQAFGRGNQATSSIMTAAQPYRTPRAAHEYPAFDGEQQTAAYYPSLTSVTASSSAGYVDVLGPVHPEEGPYSALDSDAATAWVTAPFTDPVGQWLDVGFIRPVTLSSIPVVLWSGAGEQEVTSLSVTTDHGTLVTAVPAGSTQAELSVPPGSSRTLRITVSGVDPLLGSRQVGLADVSLAGVDTSRSLAVPGVAGPDTSMLFTSAGPARACAYPSRSCSLDQMHPSEEDAALDRTFNVSGGGRWRLRIGAVARPSPATTQLLAPPEPGYTISGSSVLGDDPVVAPTYALDGNGLTSWVSAPGDQDPTLRLAWPQVRTLSRIQVGLGTQSGVRLPTIVRIRSGRQVRTVPVSPGSFGFFKPLSTNHVALTFSTGHAPNLAGAAEPMEISEVALTGLRGLRYSPSPFSRTGQPCGFGPPVFVDGVRHDTRVAGTLGQVLEGSPLAVRLCGSDTLDLGAGPHRIRVASTAGFQPVQALLVPATGSPLPATPARASRVVSWGDTERTLHVSAGPASVVWVRENSNPGWSASADGQPLQSLVVDGWAQGWQLPSGGPVTLTLRFTPQRTYLAALAVGGGSAAAVSAAAVLVVVRRRDRSTSRRRERPLLGRRPRAASAWAALVAAAALAGCGLLVGATLGALPVLRSEWLRRTIVLAAVTLAAVWQVAAGSESIGANLLVSSAVGLVVGPDFSGREHSGLRRRTPS